MYGYQDSSEVVGGTGGKFGLNSGVFVTKFEFNPNAGTSGAVGDAIDFTVQIGDKEFRKRFFPVSKVYAPKGGGEITDTNSDAYKDGLKKAVALLNGALSDIVRCFVTEEDVKVALAVPIASFKDYAEVLQRLVHSTPNWNKIPVDVFLCYQWTLSGDNTQTFLELPKDVKHGTFVIPTQGPGFKLAEGESVKYVNAEGVTHPLKRSEWFAKSAFGVQTKVEETPTASAMNGGGAATQGW